MGRNKSRYEEEIHRKWAEINLDMKRKYTENGQK